MLEALVERVVDWAEEEEAIEAVLLVGSWVRGNARDDSDVDLVILCNKPENFIHGHDWAKRFGEIERDVIEDWGMLTSIRMKYSDGLEVEFGFVEPGWAARPLDAGTQEVLEDGYRILFDRDGKVEAKLKL